jgi:hypothetical protein
MRNFTVLFIFLFGINSVLFGQGKIAKITKERWNGDEAVWVYESSETWDYDEIGREILYTHDIAQFSDYLSYNQREVHSKYNNQGLLKEEKSKMWGVSSFAGDYYNETFKEFIYDGNRNLKELNESQTFSSVNEANFFKTIYEKNETENRRTKKYFAGKNDRDALKLEHKRDSFFDENGCLIKAAIVNFDEEGNIENNRWTEYFLNEDCQLNASSYWVHNEHTDTATESARYSYEFLNNGRIERTYYEDYIPQTEEWILKHKSEIERDEEERNIREFFEMYKWNYTDTTLTIKKYNPDGTPSIVRNFKSSHGNNRPFRQTRLDSFLYHHDDEGKLILKEIFQKNYENPVRKTTETYKYYCNGQLKSILYEDLPSVRRTVFEYHGKLDCQDLEEPYFLKIFPNPTEGFIRLESNLLGAENATIQVFTVLGKEIYSERIEKVTERFVLNLPSIPAGQYIISLTTKNKTLSEKIVVN